MLKWAAIFAAVALVLAILGFGGLAGAFIDIAKILFWLAVIIAVALFVLGFTDLQKGDLAADRSPPVQPTRRSSNLGRGRGASGAGGAIEPRRKCGRRECRPIGVAAAIGPGNIAQSPTPRLTQHFTGWTRIAG